jgi:hypothetical protein
MGGNLAVITHVLDKQECALPTNEDTEMLNYVHVEGIVARNWPYEGARFLRVATYPDPGRTLKRREGGKEEPEYMTLRFEHPNSLAVAALKEGDRIRAHGWLASREYNLSLSDYAENLGGDPEAIQALRELASQKGEKVWKPHVLAEVVVEHFQILPASR